MGMRAQYYNTGQDRGSFRWRQIETKAFQIVFPDYYEPQAQRIAQMLDSVPNAVAYSLPGKIKRFPLIIHPQSVMSNGMVIWAPKRMEWWTSSPQDSYSQPWLEQLGIHEYRHVLQMENLTEGISGVLAFIFGEHITGAIVGLFVPNWFLEGDATAAETALSETGRGREGDFQMRIKAIVEDGKSFSYDKAVFGSYKDYVPNRYYWGYHLVSFGREKYGAELWESVLQNVAKKPWQLNPFERGIKKHTSFNMNKFYAQTLKYYDSIWNKDTNARINHTDVIALTPPVKVYTQYLSPKIINADSILVLKNSFEETTTFTIVSLKGGETEIRKTGSIYNNYFDLHDSTLVWCEIKKHPRWENVTYSNLILYDIKTNKRKRLSKGTRYFSPQFSPSGKEIVLVEDDKQNRSRILIFDIETGKERQIANGEYKTTFSYPVFSDDGQYIYVIALQSDGKSICRIQIRSQVIETLEGPSYRNLQQLKQQGEYLFYVADYAGISQVFALHLTSRKLHQLTNAVYGVSSFDISDDMETIVYSCYSRNGYGIEKEKLSLSTEPVFDIPKISPYPVAEKISLQEKYKIDFEIKKDSVYAVSRYPEWKHLFYFHSWSPVAIDPAEQTIHSGISIMSQNILNTSFFQAGFIWNDQEDKGSIYANYSYRKFYPIFSTSLNYTGRQVERNDVYYRWNELIWSGQIRIPFNYNQENWLYGFSPSVYYEYKKMYPLDNYPYTITNNQTVRARFSYYAEQQRAHKQINPRWGHNSVVNINKSFNAGSNAWLFSIYGTLFTPALMKTHSFNLYSGFQYNQKGSVVYSNQVSLARGYQGIIPQTLFSNKLNYTFPIIYPDFSFGRFLYVKRIYTNPFYDFMWYRDVGNPNTFNYSIGNELYIDLNIVRFDIPINAGIQISYLGNDHSIAYGFLFSLSL